MGFSKRTTIVYIVFSLVIVSVAQVLAPLFHLLALRSPIVVSVQHALTHVHLVRNDLDRYVIQKVRGNRPAPNIVRRPRRRAFTRQVERGRLIVGRLTIVRAWLAVITQPSSPKNCLPNSRPRCPTVSSSQQRPAVVVVRHLLPRVVDVILQIAHERAFGCI